MKTKHLNYSQKFLAVLIIATGLVSIAWLNPAKGKDNATQQPSEKIKTNTNSVQQKAPVTVTPVNNSFRQQLDAVAGDSTIPATPAPAAATATAPSPAPGATPMAVPEPPQPPAPMAPLAPLSVDLSDPSIADQSNIQTNVNTNVHIAQDQSSNTNFQYQPNKDEIIKQIREAQKNVQLAMKQLNEVNVKKFQADIAAATKQINWQDVSADVRKAQQESIQAMKDIDWNKITNAQKEAADALKKIDFAAINKDIARNYGPQAKIIYEKVRQEVENGLQSADIAKQYANASLDEVRKTRTTALANAAKVRAAAGRQREAVAKGQYAGQDTTGRTLDGVKRQKEAAERAAEGARRQKEGAERAEDGARRQKEAAERAAEGARRQQEGARRAEEGARRQKEAAERAEKAKATSAAYKEMINKMAADNLLDAQKDYKVEKNDNGLFINGVKQSDNIASKYSKYLQGKQFTIQRSANSYNTNTVN